MKRPTLNLLACASCRAGYEAVTHEQSGAAIRTGYLECAGCGVIIPILEGMAFFTEPRLHAGQATPQALTILSGRLFGQAGAYEDYMAAKDERDVWEAYAAFHPFNESARSVAPLMDGLAAHLQPGEAVLDTWNRTGFSGELLAARFPDHPVVALWEGDSSVLGYRGFAWWQGLGRRSANLDLVFSPPGAPLPFVDGAFGLLHGYDSLHRYRFHPFASECLRVVRPGGALVFPHLHLSNSEPDPFFERGCHQFHGRDYRAWLDAVLEGEARKGWVMSEADLFEAAPGTLLADTPDTDHYNGLVLIADPTRMTLEVAAPPPLAPDARLLVNPLLRLHAGRSAALVDDNARGGEVGRLLDRHPIYRRRLPAQPLPLSSADWHALVLAVTGHHAADVGPARDRLIGAEVLLPVACSAGAFDLQRFHANQRSPLPRQALLGRLLSRLAASEAPALRLPDGGSLSGREFHAAVAAGAFVLRADGVAAGGQVQISATAEPLAFVLMIAALSMGAYISLGHDDSGAINEEALYAEGGYAERLGAAMQGGDLRLDPAPSGAIAADGGDLDFSVLLEAAASLRHILCGGASGIADFGGLNTLLLAFAALCAGEPVILGGLARPAGQASLGS